MKVKMPSYSMVTEFSLPLLFGILTALILQNGFTDSYQAFLSQHIVAIGDIHLTFKQVINDIFMAFFFGLAVKEIIEATRPNGCLAKPINALNPILATLGGVLVPAGLYLLLTNIFLDPSVVAGGVAIAIATDIAFAWLGARLLFGSCHPAIQYLLLVAILDDAIGMLVLAFFYPSPDHPLVLSWLALTGAGMLIAFLFRLNGLKQWFPYILIGGTLSWIGMMKAGLHPALALAFIVPFIPGPKADTGLYMEQEESDHAPEVPLHDFEKNMKPIIDFGLFFFGVVNAGVTLTATAFTGLALIVFISSVVGKFIGIAGVGYLANRMGAKLPEGISLSDLRTLAMTAGVNITVSLFLADRIFGGTQYENPAKLGALLTLSIPLSILAQSCIKAVAEAFGDMHDNNKHFVH